jgi:integrase
MTRERFLSDAELERFMAAVRDRRHVNQPRDHALFALLANTGIRPSEALALTRGDLHLEAAGPWLRLSRKPRKHAPPPTDELEISRRVADVLRTYCGEMPADQKLFAFTKRQSWRLFHYYSALAGISPKYRIYSLRHTVGMRLWRYTKDLRLMQAIMGHQRLKSATIYMHVAPEIVRNALEATSIGQRP